VHVNVLINRHGAKCSLIYSKNLKVGSVLPSLRDILDIIRIQYSIGGTK
jgi:hypothetical protein